MAGEAIDEIIKCLNSNKCFVLEAGAGAGKTHTLMQTIEYILSLNYNKNEYTPKILCITYTNVAKNEIRKRLKASKNITINTLQEFLWDFIKQFQLELRRVVEEIIEEEKEKLHRKIEDARKLIDKPRKNTNIENKMREIDDIINISKRFLTNDTFANIFLNSFTHIFIDEYQDTNVEILTQLINCIEMNKKKNHLILGLFGDRMQQIYSNNKLNVNFEEYEYEIIPKLENYRSCEEIIEANNILRNDGLI